MALLERPRAALGSLPFIHALQKASPAPALPTILFLGIFCSGVGYVLWAQSLKEMDSVTVGAFLYFEPFVTVFAAWIFLSEEITFVMVLSGLIITLGVLLVNFDIRKTFRAIHKQDSSA